MGIYKEIKGNIFTKDKNVKSVWFVQCISRDLKMGAGIAVSFNREFNTKYLAMSRWELLSEDTRKKIKCLRVDRVFNLITKEKYYNKPTLKTMEDALRDLAHNIETMIRAGKYIKEIRFPLIGCGLDKLYWQDVKSLLIKYVVNEFPDITFKVFYLREEDLYDKKVKKEKAE